MDDKPTLRNLPEHVKGIILPKMDYIIHAVAGGGGQQENKQDEPIDDTDFMNDKDATDPGTGRFSEERVSKLKATYKDLDTMLKHLKVLKPDMYEATMRNI